MILELLQRLYLTCKETYFSIINALKTLFRVVVDTSYLAGSLIIQTIIEGSVQLIKLSLYYPLTFFIQTFIEGSIQLLKLFVYHPLKLFIYSPLLFFFGQLKKILNTIIATITSVLKAIISFFEIVAKTLSRAIIAIFAFAYNNLIKRPTQALSAITTFIARNIAHAVRFVRAVKIKTIRSLRLASFRVFTITKNVVLKIIMMPVLFAQHLIATLVKISEYLRMLKNAITHNTARFFKSIFTLVAQSISIMLNWITAKSRESLHLVKSVFSLALQAVVGFFSALRQLVTRLANIGTQSFYLITQKCLQYVHNLINFISLSLYACITRIKSIISTITSTTQNCAQQTVNALIQLKCHGSAFFSKVAQIFTQLTTQTVKAVTWACLACIHSLIRTSQTIINVPLAIGKKVQELTSKQISILFSSTQAFKASLERYLISFWSTIQIHAKNSATALSNNFAFLKQQGNSFAGSAKNKSSLLLEQSRERLSTMQHATRTALAGTAGFIFFSIPQATVSALKARLQRVKNTLFSFIELLKENTQKLIVFQASIIFSSFKTISKALATFINKLINTCSLFLNKAKSFYAITKFQTISLTRKVFYEFINAIQTAGLHAYSLIAYGAQGLTLISDLLSSTKALGMILAKKIFYSAPRALILKTSDKTKKTIAFIHQAINLLPKHIEKLNQLLTSSSNVLIKIIAHHVRSLIFRIQKLYSTSISAIKFGAATLAKGIIYAIGACKQLSLFILRKLKDSLASTLTYSLKATVATASAGKSGFLFLGRSSSYTLLGLWWSIKKVFYALSQVLKKIKTGLQASVQMLWVARLKIPSIQMHRFSNVNICIVTIKEVIATALSATAHKLEILIATTKQHRLSIQQYSLIGTSLYIALVLVTTYITPPSDQKLFNQIGIEQYHAFPRALPINTTFELQSISHSKGTFGSVTIKGILNYSYEAGLEAAKNIDNISIEKAETFTLKKLSSHINNRHIITTRYLITATLGIQASTSAAFPFAPTESTLVIKNNALTTHEAFYLPVASSFGTEFSTQHPTKIHMKQNAASPTETKSPKLIITLEHTGVPAYTLLTLYVLIICMTLMALMSLGALLPQTIRLAVSGVATTGLSILWILSHVLGLLPTINHLLLTLLMCLAVSLVCVGFNAKYVTQKETGPETGKTRWTLGLLLLLAVFFTLLIGL